MKAIVAIIVLFLYYSSLTNVGRKVTAHTNPMRARQAPFYGNVQQHQHYYLNGTNFKTRHGRTPRLEPTVVDVHSYKVPTDLAFPAVKTRLAKRFAQGSVGISAGQVASVSATVVLPVAEDGGSIIRSLAEDAFGSRLDGRKRSVQTSMAFLAPTRTVGPDGLRMTSLPPGYYYQQHQRLPKGSHIQASPSTSVLRHLRVRPTARG